jgi:exopolysaccharide biosynthesis WecB/TagA/CpsF family protein
MKATDVRSLAEHAFPVRDILGVPVAVADRASAMSAILPRITDGPPLLLSYANTNLLNLARSAASAPHLLDGFLVLNDGIGLDIASRWLYGAPFPANLNGTDFTPALLAAAGSEARVFLFGARPEVVAKAATAFAQRCGIAVVGHADGYGWKADPSALVRQINASGANVVLVALGNPGQEHWIREYAPQLRANLFVGVGALFDFMAGTVRRAPRWVQRLRLEWLFRLGQEPRRLARRYTVEMGTFFAAVLAQKRAGIPEADR